ncbi:MAG: DUF1858 domain-containing protein [Calditrichia bacterium]
MSNPNELQITPQVKVGKLLETYPQLESVLMGISPTFARLQNPVLRKTVGKVATLQQVANTGGIPVTDLVNRLRLEVGQCTLESENETARTDFPAAPAWVKEGREVVTLDARPMLERGEHPVDKVLSGIRRLKNGELFVLISPFVPSPLVDKAAERGFRVWTGKEDVELFKTYFTTAE